MWWRRGDTSGRIEDEARDGYIRIIFLTELRRWRLVGYCRAFRDEGELCEVVGREAGMFGVVDGRGLRQSLPALP
jgi:hypothetical protein